jgi:hypothetical protein
MPFGVFVRGSAAPEEHAACAKPLRALHWEDVALRRTTRSRGIERIGEGEVGALLARKNGGGAELNPNVRTRDARIILRAT